MQRKHFLKQNRSNRKKIGTLLHFADFFPIFQSLPFVIKSTKLLTFHSQFKQTPYLGKPKILLQWTPVIVNLWGPLTAVHYIRIHYKRAKVNTSKQIIGSALCVHYKQDPTITEFTITRIHCKTLITLVKIIT